jgi:hypothetical protein
MDATILIGKSRQKNLHATNTYQHTRLTKTLAINGRRKNDLAGAMLSSASLESMWTFTLSQGQSRSRLRHHTPKPHV